MNTAGIRTLVDVFEHSIHTFPDRDALSFVGSTPLTYRELGIRAKALSMELSANGIEKGDRVALLSENSPNWGISYFAIILCGGIVVPILPEFHEKEIRNILDHSGAKAIFWSQRFCNSISLEGIESLDFTIQVETFNFSRINPLAELAVGSYIPVQESDLASIIYTSGTTGSSKGVMLTHRNLVFEAFQVQTIQPLNENDRLLSVLPLSHTYECTIGFIMPLMQGASISYIDKPPTAAVLIPALQKVRPTIMLVVPLIIEKIFKSKVLGTFNSNPVTRFLYGLRPTRVLFHKLAGKKVYKTFGGKLHFFGIGGAPLSPETEQFLIDAKFPYAIGYGLTETAPLLAGCAPFNTRLRSTGYVMQGVEMRIDNPNPTTGEGEIQVKGDNVMPGYYKNPGLTDSVFTPDGWFKTGDLGAFDNDGFLYIKGRLKNMILGPSGENIYPEEIEAVLNKHDFVLESLVYEMKGKLVARVHLNQEAIEARYRHFKETALLLQEQMEQKINDIRQEILQKVNMEVNRYSRLANIVVQTEPFEKTPTQKIKRYLYQQT